MMKNKQSWQQNSTVESQSRKKNIIEVSHQKTMKYVDAVKGKRSDTKELNIHIKTHTLHCLKVAKSQHQLGDEEVGVVEKYEQMPANFQSLQFLFHGVNLDQKNQQKRQRGSKSKNIGKTHRQIKKICLDFYQSKELVRRVLTSSRMKLRNKLILIKYLSKVEQKVKLDRGDHDSWKCNSVGSFTL